MQHRTILITGGCGFIGHHFVEHFLKKTLWDIVILDKLTYASNGFTRLRDIDAYDDDRVRVFTVDLAGGVEADMANEIGPVDYILHLAAETHVDRSIAEPLVFIRANVLGTYGILEFARHHRQQYPKTRLVFNYFGTDEIFGPAFMPGQSKPEVRDGFLCLQTSYAEWDRYNSTNPYSATKAGGAELCLAYANTYGIPMFLTQTMNNFGERQHPEKYIPLVIRHVMQGNEVSIHADRDCKKSGRRSYIHCRNVASGIHFLLDHYHGREKYNIVGEQEIDNLGLAQLIADIIGKPLYYKLVDFHSSRPGHDLRYALSGKKMARAGWQPPIDFIHTLENVVHWTLDHPTWLAMAPQEPSQSTPNACCGNSTCRMPTF